MDPDTGIYIPKKETQQTKFLSKYPEFDGRGIKRFIKLAIIDDGIDCSLPGLQKTSTGLPKIIDCFARPSVGEIDTSTIKRLDQNNSLISLTGRKLKIPLKWKNPSGEWHLGRKSLRKLCRIKDKHEKLAEELNNIISKAAFPKISIVDAGNEVYDLKEYFDCIVWNDGKKWLSCLITSTSTNDLEKAKVLTNFRDEHDYCFLVDRITCCVSISDDGNRLQICTSTSPHGTKVAQVAASHHPNQRNSDGLAPGAQIYFIDCSLLKCSELGVDIINLSINYDWENVEILEEMQSKYGTIVTQSAGNKGPLFSTAKELKKDVSDRVLFIGSLVPSDMREWNCPHYMAMSSSRGPSSFDNTRGVSLVAPGVVYIPSARWVSTTPSHTDGTSYAAPNAAGSIACLLLALKASSIPYTPAMIKFALSNTAIPFESKDRLATGDGIIQIDAAFEFLKTYSSIISPKLLSHISIKNSNMKGIFAIKTNDNNQVQRYCINVKNVMDETIPWILRVFPRSASTYIKHPRSAKNGTFHIEIKGNRLKGKGIHYSEIRGFHLSHSEAGSFFCLPITTIIPEIVVDNFFETKMKILSSSPSYIFLRLSLEATKCSIKFYQQKTNIILLGEDMTEKDSKKSNRIDFFYDEYCDCSLRWEGEIFEVCFHKWEWNNEEKFCKFEAKFE